MSKIFIIIACLMAFSCAQVTSLNLQKHHFGKIPTKIIWLQVPGLTPEHISILKYSGKRRPSTTSFEKSLCVGSTWGHSLYEMRPDAYSGFLAQMTGKKNIKNKCTDYSQKPIWKYLSDKGYKIGIVESESKKSNSLLRSTQCGEGKNYIKDASLWSMNKSDSSKSLFHLNELKNFKKGRVYYDKSCMSGSCYTSYSKNVEGLYKNFSKNSKNHLFIARNFKYLELLKQRKIGEAIKELQQIDETLNFFFKEVKKSDNLLVLLTSSEAIDVDMPAQGKKWKSFLKNPNIIKVNKTSLTSSVFASGARAENFCGIYEQTDVLKRIFSGAKQQGLEFSIINPFE